MRKLLVLLTAFILLAGACMAADKSVSDDKIWDQVSIKLTGDPIAKGGAFKVEVHEGVVTLSGPAETERQKDRAGKLAKKVPGVKQVVNNLTVTKAAK